MPLFQYSARDQTGQMVSETLAFNSEVALRDHLRKNNLFVVRIAELRPGGIRVRRRRVGLGDLIILTRQLRTMLNAGVPLIGGLDALAQQSTNARLCEILEQVSRSVGQGATLAGTLEQYPAIFPAMLVALVRAGEEAGRLPENLAEASRQLQLQMEIRQKT